MTNSRGEVFGCGLVIDLFAFRFWVAVTSVSLETWLLGPVLDCSWFFVSWEQLIRHLWGYGGRWTGRTNFCWAGPSLSGFCDAVDPAFYGATATVVSFFFGGSVVNSSFSLFLFFLLPHEEVTL